MATITKNLGRVVGADGQDGRGISKIVKTATSGLVDTYTIMYSDNTTSTFTVTNGKDGSNSGGTGGDVTLSTATLYGVPTYFAGKKILVTGDSITDVVGNYANGHPWWQNLQDWLGLAQVYNDGKSSTGLLRNTGIYDRVDTWNTTYGTDFDAIIIMGNMNDIYKDETLSTFSLGEWGDTTINTQYGAVKLTIEKIQAHYPYTPILWVTSGPRTHYGRYSVNPVNPGHGREAEFEAYVNAIIEVCGHYNVPVCDMYHNSLLRPWIKQNNALFFQKSDGVHPNQVGHEIMAQQILQEFVRHIPSVAGTSGYVARHNISYNLNGVRVVGNTVHISTGSPYYAYLEPTEEDGVVSSVQITMGGTNITAAVYDASTKAINIGAVTGNVVITAEGAVTGVRYAVTNNLTNVASSNSTTMIVEGKTYVATLSGTTGYNVGDVIVAMNGTDITSTAYNPGTRTITVVNVSGDITITAEGVRKTLTITNMLTGVINNSADTTKLYGEPYSTTLSTTEAEETIQYIYITMGETDVTNNVYNTSSGAIAIPSVTDNVVITASTEKVDTIGIEDFSVGFCTTEGEFKAQDSGLDNYCTPEILTVHNATITFLTDDIMVKVVEYDNNGTYTGSDGWQGKVANKFVTSPSDSINIVNKNVRIALANTTKQGSSLEQMYAKIKIAGY